MRLGDGMKIVLCVAALALAGCTSTALVAPSDGGYAAIKVVRPLRVPHVMTSVWELPVGTAFVADRRRADGTPLYCGQASLGDALIRRSEFVCATYTGGVLGMRADQAFASPRFSVPPGAIEEFHLR